MYKTAVYTLVNGGIQGLADQEHSKAAIVCLDGAVAVFSDDSDASLVFPYARM